MKSLFEQNCGTYSLVGDYNIPNLTAPDEYGEQIDIWGLRRLNYLKSHRRVLYINLLTSGKLTEHLHEIDTAALCNGFTGFISGDYPALESRNIHFNRSYLQSCITFASS